MSPIMPCPFCGTDTNFHEDEVEGVEDGRVVCLDCGMEMEKATFIVEVIAGEHPDFVERTLEEEGEDDNE